MIRRFRRWRDRKRMLPGVLAIKEARFQAHSEILVEDILQPKLREIGQVEMEMKLRLLLKDVIL